MIECRNGTTKIDGDGGTLLAELSSIVQAMKTAMGEESSELITMAVAVGMSGVLKGERITEEEFYGEMN